MGQNNRELIEMCHDEIEKWQNWALVFALLAIFEGFVIIALVGGIL